MLTQYSRLKFRRKMRAKKKVFARTAETASKEIERHITRRFHNWRNAQRFVVGWIALVVIIAIGLSLQVRMLSSNYMTIRPIAGGVYSEGMLGNIKNVNPLFATSSADNAVSTLLFGSLLTYDEKNNIKGDIASTWESTNLGKVYTVAIKKNIVWHDGEPLNADDVVFTYKTIQNPDTQSPLYSSWRGIKVEKVDDYIVKFTLPNPYSPFLHLLNNGIVPEHVLGSIEKSQLRSARFNSKEPVGSGPFKWRDITVIDNGKTQSEIIQLVKNPQYYRGSVQLDGFTVKTFADKKSLIDALRSKEIIGAAAIDDLDTNNSFETLRFNQTSALMVFLNTSQPLLQDKTLRQAVVMATDPSLVSQKLDYPTIAVREPILKGQLGYDASLKQQATNVTEASKLLDGLGWTKKEGDAYRKKDGRDLELSFTTENSPEYAILSEEIQRQWAQVGIKTNVVLEDPAEIASTSLASKDYDALLYAINIGPDPDVYVYWHSSQADPNAKPGFNLSRYKSAKADASLEAARSRTDPALRAVKYKPFLQAWQQDAPAIGIHQTRFSYTTNIPVYNLAEGTINSPSDRYKNVQNWQINRVKSSNEQ